MKTFLLSALDNLGEFKHCDHRIVRKEIKKDLHLSSPNNNPTIKKIIDLRNNSIAHLDGFRVEEDNIERFFEYDSRNPDMVSSLYEDLGKLLDKYTQFLWGQNLFLGTFPKGVEKIITTLNDSAVP